MKINISRIIQSYLKAFLDAIHFKMLIILLFPFVLSVTVVYFSWGHILAFADSLILISSENAVLSFFASIASFLLSTIGLVLYIIVIALIFQMIFSIFYAPFIVSFVHNKYYSHITREEALSFIESIIYFLKIVALLLFFMILCIPVYFIPFVGHIVFFVIFFIFFKNTITLDVAAAIFCKKDYMFFLSFYKKEIWVFTLSLYILSLIPIVNFFVLIFQIAAFTHFVFSCKEKMIQGIQ